MFARKKSSGRNFSLYSSYQFYTPGFSELLKIALWLLVGALLGNAVSALLLFVLGSSEDATVIATTVAYPIMFIPVMIYASYKSHYNEMFERGYKLDNNHFQPVNGFKCAVFAVLGTFAAAMISDGFTCLLPEMPERFKQLMEAMTSGNIWLNLLCVSIFAPFFEEWLCRGVILRGLLNFAHKGKNGQSVNGIRPSWAIVISALCFAVMHLNPWQAIPAFIFGCLFGYVYYKTGSLKLTMLMHCANNTVSVVISNIDELSSFDSWCQILGPAKYSVALLISAAVLYFIVRRFGDVSAMRPQGNCDELDGSMM